MAPQPERIASLETKVTIQWVLLGIIAAGATGWLYYLTQKIDSVSASVSKIEGRLGAPFDAMIDGLNNPKSPSDLQKTVAAVAAQARLALLIKQKIAPEKLANIATSLRSATEKTPNTPGIWDAVSSVATLRNANYITTISKSVDPDCDLNKPDVDRIPLGPDGTAIYGIKFSNCRLNLDRLSGTEADRYHHDVRITEKDAMGNVVTDMSAHGQIKLPIVLLGGTLIYSGGELPFDLTLVITKNSRIELDAKSQPTPQGQKLLLAALSSTNPLDMKASL